MTENGKIFLTKNAIYNLLSQQQLSVGLSLYIIKDIKEQLEKGYNDILKSELQQEQIKIQEQKQINLSNNNNAYPIQWIPQQEEEEKNNQDQAD